MGSLITYSGIATKVKAMERWRIKDGQFEEMASLESVPEAVDYLRPFLTGRYSMSWRKRTCTGPVLSSV